MKVFSLIIILLTLAAVQVQAASSLSVSVSLSKTSAKSGDQVTATFVVTNTLTKRPPIVFTCNATYQDWTGTTFNADPATLSLSVIQPLTPSGLQITPPATLVYNNGTCAVDTVAVAPTVQGSSLVVPLTKVLNEGDTSTVTMGFTVR